MPCCDEYVDLISAAIDGALSEEETARLEEHLARCPECRALYEDFAAIHSALGDVPPVAVPPAFACMDQVMAAIDHPVDLRKAKVKYRRYWPPPSLPSYWRAGRASPADSRPPSTAKHRWSPPGARQIPPPCPKRGLKVSSPSSMKRRSPLKTGSPLRLKPGR